MKKSFLFLQGPASPFFKELGEELLDAGHRVLRINFNSGDRFFWNGENTADYKYPMAEFANYIGDVATLRKITDLVIFDDSAAVHKAAIEALKNHKIRIHVFANGYFGENWITLEDRVFGDKTILPRDPRFYLRSSASGHLRAKKFGGNVYAKNLLMMKYHVASLFAKTGEFKAKGRKAYVASGLGVVSKRLQQDKVKAALAGISYFLADYDLSRKASLIRSFAKDADGDDYLVFYTTGKAGAASLAKTREIAEKYKVAERVLVVQKANFRTLVKPAKAYITNNNINGLVAIQKGRPVLALAAAIYNIEGLANQCGLADFWKNPVAPDAELYRKFRNYVISRTQVNGSFYNRKGMKLALAVCARRLDGEVRAQGLEVSI